MMDVREFQEKLQELLALAGKQEKNLSHEDILHCFRENQLSTEQLKSLYEYLRLQGIRIGGTALESMDLELQTEGKSEDSLEESKKDGLEFISLAEKKEEKQELTGEDQICLEEYEAYLKGLPAERGGEIENLLRKFAGGNMAVRERLSQLYLPYMIAKARELYREGFFIGDLIQEGNMALLSVKVADIPEEQADHWMKDQICAGMNNWVEEQTEQKFQDDYLVEKVRKLEAAIREIAGEEEQKFSVEELSAYLDMDEEEIRSVLSLTSEGAEEKEA